MSGVERETLSIMKACAEMGVSRRTIYNWIRANKVEYIRTAGGSIRIYRDSLWQRANVAERPRVTVTKDGKAAFRLADGTTVEVEVSGSDLLVHAAGRVQAVEIGRV